METIEDRSLVNDEQRAFSSDRIEVREDADGKVTFDGIASAVGKPYTVRDMFGEFEETIAPGAFNRTLKQRDDVRLLVNHTGVPLARTKAGTLNLSTTPDLRAVAELDVTNPTAQEIRSAMGRGDVDEMSIGFRVKDQEWSDDYTVRTIREVQLLDVSVVTFPASPHTSAQLRTIDEIVRGIDQLDADDLAEVFARFEAEIARREALVSPTIETDPAPTFDVWAARAALWDLRLPA